MTLCEEFLLSLAEEKKPLGLDGIKISVFL